jgi:hypothetical protein
MQMMFSRWRLAILLGVILSLMSPAGVWAQRRRGTTRTTQPQPTATPQPTQAKPTATPTPAQPQATPAAHRTELEPATGTQAAKPKDTKGTWRLKISTGQPRLISLKADGARAPEIAAELQRKLDIPVKLSGVMEKARLTIEFTGTPLEGALRMIAPQPYIDYEVTGDTGVAKPVAIYLYGLNEPPPADTEVVRGDSEAILIEGNTEEGTEAESEKDRQEKALNIKIERNQVTLHAKRQPLTAVLFEIASKVDIPFEMKYDSSEIVDVDLNNATMEQVVRTLSPNIRLYQRTDLQTYETRPLRIVLAPPANAQQTIKM